MEYGILFEGDNSPVTAELSEALKALGLQNRRNIILTDEVLSALNIYRGANGLPILDFCDPVSLRTLGINVAGDELITLAACAKAIGETELEYYDIASEIVKDSRSLGITVTEAAARKEVSFFVGDVSLSAMLAAVLAFINN